jgi:putative FmdB family regulatory protein
MAPLYEYECEQCKQVTEEIVYSAQPEPTTCTSCGGVLKKLMSVWGGYSINGNNSASTRPKGAGSKGK